MQQGHRSVQSALPLRRILDRVVPSLYSLGDAQDFVLLHVRAPQSVRGRGGARRHQSAARKDGEGGGG